MGDWRGKTAERARGWEKQGRSDNWSGGGWEERERSDAWEGKTV